MIAFLFVLACSALFAASFLVAEVYERHRRRTWLRAYMRGTTEAMTALCLAYREVTPTMESLAHAVDDYARAFASGHNRGGEG